MNALTSDLCRSNNQGVVHERNPNYLGAPKYYFVPKPFTNELLTAVFETKLGICTTFRTVFRELGTCKHDLPKCVIYTGHVTRVI